MLRMLRRGAPGTPLVFASATDVAEWTARRIARIPTRGIDHLEVLR
jgi:hypothetical protein